MELETDLEGDIAIRLKAYQLGSVTGFLVKVAVNTLPISQAKDFADLFWAAGLQVLIRRSGRYLACLYGNGSRRKTNKCCAKCCEAFDTPRRTSTSNHASLHYYDARVRPL